MSEQQQLQQLMESTDLYWLDSNFGSLVPFVTVTILSTVKSDLKGKIDEWNAAYRNGKPVVDDSVYDATVGVYESLFEELTDTHSEIPDSDERKQPLPIVAASMNKCKTVVELRKWAKSKGINFDTTEFVISAKLDGITLVAEESTLKKTGKIRTWTKGRDGMGLFVPEHFQTMNIGRLFAKDQLIYTRGEAIMKKRTFNTKKYVRQETGKLYENPRNLVSGKFTDKDVDNEIVSNIDYIRFHMDSEGSEFMDKADQLNVLNMYNTVSLPYKLVTGAEITEELMYSLFKEFSQIYEIDGLIVEVNNSTVRRSLGLETSTNNPCFARAFKGAFEETAETEVVEVRRQISKQGYLKPVLVIKPVRLDGATVTNVFADNERWLCLYGIGVGTKLKMKRSGMVIPRIIEVEGKKVLSAEEFNKWCDKNWSDKSTVGQLISDLGLGFDRYEFPQEFIDGKARWNENRVEIELIEANDTVQIQRNIAFFEILKTDGVSDGIIEDLYRRGYTTIKSVLNLFRSADQRDKIYDWEGWGMRKSHIISTAINKALDEATLAKLMHASGCFKGLGSSKLQWVLDVYYNEKPTCEQLMKIDGYSETSAMAYLDGFENFYIFVHDAGIKIPEKKEAPKATGDMCNGWIVCFTGVRSAELEGKIIANGGTVASGVSSKTTHLVCKDPSAGSSKLEKAAKNGTKIISIDDFAKLF